MQNKAKRAEPYQVLFTTNGKTYKGVLNEKERCFQINGVQIEVEFDNVLYIENPQNYKECTFAFLNYEEKWGSLFLRDFQFTYTLPITLRDTKTNSVVAANFTGVLTDTKGVTQYLWKVLGKSSDKRDTEYAILDLQSKLYPRYEIQCCCCCKYGQANPYGGDPYINFICFRKNKSAYETLGIVDKADWAFFQDEDNISDTRPLYCCEDFAFRKSVLQYCAKDATEN